MDRDPTGNDLSAPEAREQRPFWRVPLKNGFYLSGPLLDQVDRPIVRRLAEYSVVSAA
jgi:hypothetical protein